MRHLLERLGMVLAVLGSAGGCAYPRLADLRYRHGPPERVTYFSGTMEYTGPYSGRLRMDGIVYAERDGDAWRVELADPHVGEILMETGGARRQGGLAVSGTGEVYVSGLAAIRYRGSDGEWRDVVLEDGRALERGTLLDAGGRAYVYDGGLLFELEGGVARPSPWELHSSPSGCFVEDDTSTPVRERVESPLATAVCEAVERLELHCYRDQARHRYCVEDYGGGRLRVSWVAGEARGVAELASSVDAWGATVDPEGGLALVAVAQGRVSTMRITPEGVRERCMVASLEPVDRGAATLDPSAMLVGGRRVLRLVLLASPSHVREIEVDMATCESRSAVPSLVPR